MIKIYFKNYEPAQEIRSSLYAKMERIQNLSPCRSTICGCFEKDDKDKYNGSLYINSQVACFSQTTSADSEKELIKDIQRKIFDQISIWKEKRFEKNDEFEKYYDLQATNCMEDDCLILEQNKSSQANCISIATPEL